MQKEAAVPKAGGVSEEIEIKLRSLKKGPYKKKEKKKKRKDLTELKCRPLWGRILFNSAASLEEGPQGPRPDF